MSAVSIRSLMPIGTPCKGPCVGLRSHARAWASAFSGSRYSQAPTRSSRTVIRSRQAVTSASLVMVPAAIAAAASTAVSSYRGFISIYSLGLRASLDWLLTTHEGQDFDELHLRLGM